MNVEGMTIEECRKAQRVCSDAVNDHVEAIRREVKDDIAAIREAVQEIDRAVAKIKGFLGINGETPHIHGRKSDGDDNKPHQHQRREADGDWRVNIMWKAGLWLLTAMLAPIMFAVGTALAKRLMP